MLRALVPRNDVDSFGFRLRGKDVSRIEGLSDGVFALALTLLIVSVEVPSTYQELMKAIRMLPVFAACFAIIMWFWGLHYSWFRRYGLNDVPTLMLNSVLLFVVLFYVFPLKYLMALFLSATVGAGPQAVKLGELRTLFVLYAAGFSAVTGVYALMHAHAYRRREDLGLSRAEAYLVRASVIRMLSLVLLGVASGVIALSAQGAWVAAAGFLYMLVGVSEGLLAWRLGERARRIASEDSAAPAKGVPAVVGIGD